MISVGLQNQGRIVEIRNKQRIVTDYALFIFFTKEPNLLLHCSSKIAPHNS